MASQLRRKRITGSHRSKAQQPRPSGPSAARALLLALLATTALLVLAGTYHAHSRAWLLEGRRRLLQAAHALTTAPSPPALPLPPPPPVYNPRSASALPPLLRTAAGILGQEFLEPAKRFPSWWAWGQPRPAQQAGPHHQCLPLNAEFSAPTVTTVDTPTAGGGSRLVRALSYGHWRVRWPRFAAPEHAAWFAGMDLVKWRASHECVQAYDQRRASLRAQRAAAHANANTTRAQQPPLGAPLPALLQPRPAIHPAAAAAAGATAGGEGQGAGSEPPPPGGWAAPSDTSDHWLYFCEPRFTEGRVVLTDSVRLSEVGPEVHDCGPGSDAEALMRNAAAAFPNASEADVQVQGPLFWGVIPAVWTFQHWCENTLPKLAQVEAAVAWEEVWGVGNGGVARGSGAAGALQQDAALPPRLLQPPPAPPPRPQRPGATQPPTPRPPHHPLWHQVTANQELLPDRFPIVQRLYTEVLTMRPPLDVRAAPLATPRLLHACAAPPLHPMLWQLGQSHVLRLGPPPPLRARRKLIYCSRRDANSTEHPGRLLVNEEAVVALLRAQCAAARALRGSGCAGVEFYNHRAFHNNASAMAEFFADAIGMVSPHGGCLTNVNFLPCNAAVLELMPLVRGELVPTEPHWHMLYMQSAFLEQRYFMLPIEAEADTYDHMHVPLEHLASIVKDMLSVDAPQG